jgi:very-short-patch-repair endonuclease
MERNLNKTFIIINKLKINTNYLYNLPYNSDLKLRARELRKSGNLTEVIFWQNIKNKQFHNLDFDRQKVIGNYIVDFYLKEFGIAIEIDGSSHNDKIEYDKKRDEFLVSLGIRIFRVYDKDVRFNLDGVLRGLEEFIISNFDY